MEGGVGQAGLLLWELRDVNRRLGFGEVPRPAREAHLRRLAGRPASAGCVRAGRLCAACHGAGCGRRFSRVWKRPRRRDSRPCAPTT